jgi:hypothetical protein
LSKVSDTKAKATLQSLTPKTRAPSAQLFIYTLHRVKV